MSTVTGLNQTCTRQAFTMPGVASPQQVAYTTVSGALSAPIQELSKFSAFALSAWRFRSGDLEYTIRVETDVNGTPKLLAKPFSRENVTSYEKLGCFATTRGQYLALESKLRSGEIEFILTLHKGNDSYKYDAHFMVGNTVRCRGFNATLDGPANGGPSVPTSLSGFVQHSQKNADKYARTVSDNV